MLDAEKSTTGFDPNVVAALTYVLGWVTGVAFLLLERDSKFVRFHAMQSTIVFLSLSVLCILLQAIPILGMLLTVFFVIPVAAVLWLVLLFKAYQGQRFKLPVAGDMADQRL